MPCYGTLLLARRLQLVGNATTPVKILQYGTRARLRVYYLVLANERNEEDLVIRQIDLI